MIMNKPLKILSTPLVLSILLLITLSSCSQSEKRTVFDIKEFITDTITVPTHINDRIYFWQVRHIENSDEVITYLKDSDFMLYKYSIPKKEVLDSVSFKKFRPIYTDYLYKGEDSLFVLLENYKLVLITKKGEKHFDFKDIFKKEIDSLAYPGNKNNPINLRENVISFSVATNRIREDFNSPNPNEILYNYIVQMVFENDSIKMLGKFNPYDPEILEKSYYETRHSFTPKANTITYFYDYQNIIYQVDYKNQDTLIVQLNPTNYDWKKSKPIKYDSISNNYYLFNYVLNRYKISNFIFDPYTGNSLFFIEKPILYFKEDGSIVKAYETEITLFVLDEKLQIIKEVEIPQNIVNGPRYSFVTKNGLYLRIAEPFQNLDKNETLYYKINLY